MRAEPGEVAQIFNLPYRRFSIGSRLARNPTPGLHARPHSSRQRVENPRYGRLKICATPDFKLAFSRRCWHAQTACLPATPRAATNNNSKYATAAIN
jgi:hypothetical protein